MKLVIVESPAKAKTINKYLGEDYIVKASMGHVRDLPPKKLGVDIDKGFEPEYVNIFGVPFTFLPHEGGHDGPPQFGETN